MIDRDELDAGAVQFYSVEIPLHGAAESYVFRLRNESHEGMYVTVNDDSRLLRALKSGDIVNMSYSCEKIPGKRVNLRTVITRIRKADDGAFKGRYIVGLSMPQHDAISNEEAEIEGYSR